MPNLDDSLDSNDSQTVTSFRGKMNDTLKGVLGRIGWSFILTGVILLFSIIVALTKYHGTANLAILGYGLVGAIGAVSVIIFARWSPAVAIVGGLIGALVCHVAAAMLIAAAIGFVLAFATLLYWRNLDRYRQRRVRT